MVGFAGDKAFCFGPFRLYRAQKLLLEDGHPVRLGSRALDLLTALVERAGEVVAKEELVAIAWPRTIVEESSLRVHIAALRKVLGDGQAGQRYIANEPGRGYCFVAPVSRLPIPGNAPAPAPASSSTDTRLGGLPARLTRMIGRDASAELLAAQLKHGRFVTLVGPGGIGKTTLAMAIAEAQTDAFEHGVCFVDLAPLVNGQLVPSVLMAALGLMPRAEGLENLETFLRERRLLVVFDNCEHLLESLTPLIERLLKIAPGLHLLATSREPLRAEGEWLHRLGALATPAHGSAPSAEEALRHPAVALFVERATASVDDFALTDRDAPVVAELCRRLEGNPLAIELAAARVDLFGLRGLATQLDAHLLQIRGDRRDAPQRHHSLAAMLDWSYQLLAERERLILNRLAIFQGWFPLSAAAEFILFLAPEEGLGEDEVLDAVANLAAKSLLISDASGEAVRFRLLELTRTFVLAELDRLDELARLGGRHADHTLVQVERAAKQWTAFSKREWFGQYLWLVDEMRAALAWSFGPRGDALTGVKLTVAMWSLVNVINPFDQPDAVERALAALQRLPEQHPVLEMRINIALAIKLELVDQRNDEAMAATERALQLAAEFDNPEFEAETLLTVAIIRLAMASYADAEAAWERMTAAARKSGNAKLMLVGERVGSQVSHFVGAYDRSRTLAERVLNHPQPRGQMGTVGGGLDHRVSMRIMLSRTLWIEGLADQAAELAEETRALAADEDVLAQTQTASLCLCPVALWRGDTALAAQRIAEFRALAASHATGGIWLPTSALIPWWREDSLEGLQSLLWRDHLMTAYSHLVTSEAERRAASGLAGWCGAELLRARGENLLREHGVDAPDAVRAARALFDQALVQARSLRAPAWELRAATSLARLHQRLGEDALARALLEPVHARFTEGFGTADLRAAAAVLNAS